MLKSSGLTSSQTVAVRDNICDNRLSQPLSLDGCISKSVRIIRRQLAKHSGCTHIRVRRNAADMLVAAVEIGREEH